MGEVPAFRRLADPTLPFASRLSRTEVGPFLTDASRLRSKLLEPNGIVSGERQPFLLPVAVTLGVGTGTLHGTIAFGSGRRPSGVNIAI